MNYLTVIAVNAQFAAQNIETGAVDEETVTDLTAISAEAKRLAQMVTSLVGIGRMQGGDGALFSLSPLLTETARIYQSLFARKKNTLTAEEVSELLPHVFERYFHGEKGGNIDIKSEEGRGTTVWFTLPVKEETKDEGDRDNPAGGGR